MNTDEHYWQDWKYTLFEVFIRQSQNIPRINANIMADVVENIGFKFILIFNPFSFILSL